VLRPYCLEMFASNSAAVRYYSESTAVRRGEVGGNSAMARLSFQDILRLVEQGDPKACKAIDPMAHYLGCGLANRCPNACLPSPLLPWHGDGATTALQRCCNGIATAPLPWASRCPWEHYRSNTVAVPSQCRGDTQSGRYGRDGVALRSQSLNARHKLLPGKLFQIRT
jgi:hypothetical protein